MWGGQAAEERRGYRNHFKKEKDFMEKWLYVMFIEKTKTYNRLTKAAVERHVANLRALDEAGHIELAGVFKGYPGVAGCIFSGRRATRRPRSCASGSRWWRRASLPIS